MAEITAAMAKSLRDRTGAGLMDCKNALNETNGDMEGAIEAASMLLAYFPQNNNQEPPTWPTDDEIDRQVPEAGALIPPSSTGSYDVRAVIRALADDGEIDRSKVAEAILKYGIDTNKPNPMSSRSSSGASRLTLTACPRFHSTA